MIKNETEQASSLFPGQQSVTVQQALALALQHFKVGELSEAESICQQIVQSEPDQAIALQMLGLIAYQVGNSERATELITKALSSHPGFTEAHNNLGVVFMELERLDDALACFHKALDCDPQYTSAHCNKGLVLQKLGRLDEAIACFYKATGLNPDYADAHNNLGVAFMDLGRMDDAIASFHKTIYINPGDAQAHYNLGLALVDTGRHEEALISYNNAIIIQPDYCEAHNDLGNAFKELGRLYEAVDHYRKAAVIDPDFPEAHNNLGAALLETGRLDDAIACFIRAIDLKPDYANPHHSLGTCLMSRGELCKGAVEYEWRWQTDSMPMKPEFNAPLWDDKEVVNGRRLLVWGEQGIGDEVLFSSMFPDHQEAGAELMVECDARLVPLFERSFPGVKCFPRAREGQSVEKIGQSIDFQISSGSQVQWLRPDMASFPKRRSYLVADQGYRDRLRNQYKQGGGDILVGIAWESRLSTMQMQKSMSLDDWRPILGVPQIRFINLQYGDTVEQREIFQAQTGLSIFHDPAIDPLKDIDGAAAQIAAMDLVISSSNVTVHIAGGLGIPTWAMIPLTPIWYWMVDREDSPWYPSVRLFRQTGPGQWGDVIQRVGNELSGLVHNHGQL